MPFVNGVWVPEDANVATRVSGLIAADSPFIQRAKTEARQAANRRGLLNTSIAIQAGEAAAQAAALPIASQEAAQIQQSNISAQQAQQTGQLQRERFGQETAEAIASRAFEASELGLARTQETTELGLARTSTEALAAREITARTGLLSTELQSRETVAAAQRELTATEGAAQRALITTEGVATREAQRFTEEQRIEADRILAEKGIVANEILAQLNADTRVQLANLSAGSQEAIAAMNVESSERQKVTEAVVNFASQYETSFAAIAGNTDIPAEYRDSVTEHLALLRDSNFAMIESLYNIDLSWASPATVVA